MVGGDSFTGGTYKAECRVFEIESAKYLGGFEANAKMHRASRQARKGANLEQTLENLVNSEMESGLRGFGVAPESYCSWQ